MSRNAASKCSSFNPPRELDRMVRECGTYTNLEPEQFAYSLLTRSQRISHENLRLRDRAWLEGMEGWLAARANGDTSNRPLPPMFLPFRLRDMQLVNRVVMSPMATYSAHDGLPNDFHLVHLGARALGGAGLIITEMTCVTPQGRITPGCAGMYTDAHMQAWQRIVDFVHGNAAAKICLQLGHSGLKGSTKLGWEGMDEPLDADNWEVIAPSPVPWSNRNQVPCPNDSCRHGPRMRCVRACHALRRASRVPHGRTARGTWLPAVVVHLATDKSPD